MILRSKKILLFLSIFVLLLVAAGFTKQVTTWFGLDFWSTSATSIGDRLKEDDLNSYIVLAKHIVKNDFDTSEKEYLLRQTSPAFSAVIALVFKLSGEESYLPKMMALSILAWTLSLYLLILSFPGSISASKILFGILVIFLFPDFRNWTLGQGILMSESLTTAIFVAGIAFVTRSIFSYNSRSAIVGVSLLSVAANFRPALDGLCSLVFVFLFIFLILSKFYFRNAGLVPNSSVRFYVLCFAIFFAGTAPWKMYSLVHYGAYSFSTSGAGLPIEGKIHWRQEVPQWLHVGNTACQVDPKLCAELSADPGRQDSLVSLSIKTMITHPWEWLKLRVTTVNWFWIGVPWELPQNPEAGIVFRYFEGLFFIFAVVTGLWLSAKGAFSRNENFLRRRTQFLICFAIISSFLGAYLIAFSYLHYEVRYSLHLKIIGVWGLAVSLCIYRQRANQNLPRKS